jgi:hypothetical protein
MPILGLDKHARGSTPGPTCSVRGSGGGRKPGPSGTKRPSVDSHSKHRPARRWQRFLDSYGSWTTGPAVAWNSEGHRRETQFATDAREQLYGDVVPAGSETRYKLNLVLDLLPEDVVDADITMNQFSDLPRVSLKLPVPIIGPLIDRIPTKPFNTPKTGQAEHAMAYQGQSRSEAYAWTMRKIIGSAQAAAQLFWEWPRIRESAYPFDSSPSEAQTTRYSRTIANRLAHGLHPLQDSFAPRHVERRPDGDGFKIVRFLVWKEQDEKDHKEEDKTWRGEDGALSKLGSAAENATEMLLTYFVYCVTNKRDIAENILNTLVKKYFLLTD